MPVVTQRPLLQILQTSLLREALINPKGAAFTFAIVMAGDLHGQQTTSLTGINSFKKAVTGQGDACRAYLESVARALTMTCSFEYGCENAFIWSKHVVSFFSNFKELPNSDPSSVYTGGLKEAKVEIEKELYLQVLYLIRFFYLELLEVNTIINEARHEAEAAAPSNHQVTNL